MQQRCCLICILGFFNLLLHAQNPAPTALNADATPFEILRITGLGNGYSAPVIDGESLFITGETGGLGYLYKYRLDGSLSWKITYGKEWTISYPGTRANPVLADSLIYLCSGTGDLLCIRKESGSILWKINLEADFGGIVPTFGYSMPVTLDGNKLYCSPGGSKNNVVAIDRFTGRLIWSTVGKGETAGYGEAQIVRLPGRKLLVTASELFIMGIDADNGNLLWDYPLSFKGQAPCNTPRYDGKNLFWVAGPGNGAVSADLGADGSTIKVNWKNPGFDTFFGDFVEMDNFLYGFSDYERMLVAVSKNTGEVVDSVSLAPGGITTKSDTLITYSQDGTIAFSLIQSGKLNLLKSFKLREGTREHFSHPVVSRDKLFIRHGNVLVGYKI